jgi:hypothetical protein
VVPRVGMAQDTNGYYGHNETHVGVDESAGMASWLSCAKESEPLPVSLSHLRISAIEVELPRCLVKGSGG